MNRISKKLKRAVLIALVFAMMIPSISGLAVTQRQKALSAYDKWLSGSKVLVLPRGSQGYDLKNYEEVTYAGTKASEVKFALIYLDNDSIPELAVYDKNYCYSVLTYRNGKVVRLFGKFENFAYPTKYYKKKCAFIAVSPMISKMNKFIVRDNAAGKYFMKFQDDIKSTTEYYRGSSNHKQISSARLRSFMKNYTNGATLTRITYYQNTKTNRNKYLK